MSNKYEGHLCEENLTKIENWLQDTGINRECIFCNKNKWTVKDNLVWLWAPSNSGKVPEVLMVCLNCGNTLHFNAVVMGLVE